MKSIILRIQCSAFNMFERLNVVSAMFAAWPTTFRALVDSEGISQVFNYASSYTFTNNNRDDMIQSKRHFFGDTVVNLKQCWFILKHFFFLDRTLQGLFRVPRILLLHSSRMAVILFMNITFFINFVKYFWAYTFSLISRGFYNIKKLLSRIMLAK